MRSTPSSAAYTHLAALPPQEAIAAYKTACQTRARDVEDKVISPDARLHPGLVRAKNQADVAILSQAYGRWQATSGGGVKQAVANVGTGLGLLARAGSRLAAASLVSAAWCASAALLPSERLKARLSFTLSHHCLQGAWCDVRQAFAAPHRRVMLAGAHQMRGAAQEGNILGTFGPVFTGVR